LESGGILSKIKRKRDKKYNGELAGILPITIRFSSDDARHLKMEPHTALEQMAEGLGDGDSFNTILLRLNTGKILAERIFNDDAVLVMCAGLVAMIEVNARHCRMEKWGISPDEREAVGEALVLADDIQDGTTRREQLKAMKYVVRTAHYV
jgi:hypothetical protein